MFSEPSIRRVASEVERLRLAVHSTFAVRHKGRREQEAWERACVAFHGYDNELYKLWDPVVWRDIRGQSGAWRNAALCFLEVDPWFFRAGYLKEKLCHALKQAQLTPREKQRVQGVLLHAVRQRFRREFRSYCRLAGHVSDDRWLQDLSLLADGDDKGARIRARWMLSQIAQYQKIHRGRTRSDSNKTEGSP
jgi:hypothetical protein